MPLQPPQGEQSRRDPSRVVTGEMRPMLGPIEAWVGGRVPVVAGTAQVHADPTERPAARNRDHEGAAGAPRDEPTLDESVQKCDAEPTGQVSVAHPPRPLD